jgi:cytochrome P450
LGPGGKRVFGRGLLTEDPLHLKQRRMMQPAFHQQRIAAYADNGRQNGTTAALARRDDGRPGTEKMRLTLAIVCKAV